VKEVVLRHFFEGHASAAELARDLEGTRLAEEPPGFRSSANYRIEPMARTFEVRPEHVVRLVDAVLGGELSVSALGTLVFCMEAAPERWRWDTDTPEGERIAGALFWLGTPEVNYPLTAAVLSKIRLYLLTGENTLSEADLARG
jgi:hypothetical protein